MMLAGAACGSSALASLTPLSTDPGTGSSRLIVWHKNVQGADQVSVDTLTIDDTLGEQVSAALTMVNPSPAPVLGDPIEVRYDAAVLFAGTIDRITERIDLGQAAHFYDCTCTDWSQILYRRKIVRNFVNLPLENIVDSLLDNELAGEGLTLGRVDRGTTIPLVDSRGGSAFDVCRDAAGVTGQTFYVGYDKSLNFVVTSNDAAPLTLSTVRLESLELVTDRETYRNRQIVDVTGTAANSGDEVLTTRQQRENADQIAARAALEGGSGVYEVVESITHPTRNGGADLALLGIGYANLRLATSGVPRRTLRCRVRGYGFRAGQFAEVDFSPFGLSGTWLIQRVSLAEQAGQYLTHELELVESNLQQRAYESWLTIVQTGKITVQMPGSLTNNVELFTANDTWIVPAGVTSATFTSVGGSGGGGGACDYLFNHTTGGQGGASGLAVSIVTVSTGQAFTFVIGAAGTAGANVTTPTPATSGTDGGLSSVVRGVDVICQAEGGSAGTGAGFGFNGTNGANGGGAGDAVTVGGGRIGGRGGTTGVSPVAGTAGYVQVDY